MELNLDLPDFVKDVNAMYDENPNLIFDLLGLSESKEKEDVDLPSLFESIYKECN